MPNEVTVKMLVWILFAAVTVAVLYAYAMQKMLVKLAKRLIAHEAASPETARTLEQIGFANPLTRGLLAHFAASGSTLSRAIVCKELSAPTKEKDSDGANKDDEADLLFREKPSCAYYLPTEKRTKSFEKHLGAKQSPWAILGLLVVLFLVASVASGVIDFLGGWASGLVEGDNTPGVHGTADAGESLLEEQEKLNREEQERIEREKAEAEAEAAISEEEAENAANQETADATDTPLS